MTDNLDDFFSDNAQWVNSSHDASFVSAMPPQPPKSRKDMRRHREQKRRRRYITIIAALVVIVLIGVGGFFGVRALKHWKAVNEPRKSRTTLLKLKSSNPQPPSLPQ